MIDYGIVISCVLLAGTMLATAKCLVNINELDKRIDEVIDEEKRQNKRIDILEKRELIRQSEQKKRSDLYSVKRSFQRVVTIGGHGIDTRTGELR